MGITRREWLGAAAAAGAGLTLGAGCGIERRPSPPGESGDPFGEFSADGGVAEFSHDPVATFEVSHDRAIVWAYSSQPTLAQVEVVAAATNDESRFSTPFFLERDTGQSGWVELGDLVPDQAYRYRVHYGTGLFSEWGAFRTAPRPDADADARFVFSADIGNDPRRDSPIFGSIRQAMPAFFVCLGDWPYADTTPAAITLAQYRAKHQRARTSERVRALLRDVPVRCIYDDHDVECNWDQAFRESQPDRLSAALAAWDEFCPRLTPHRYQRWRWGRHLELYLLDTRLYRSVNESVDDPAKTMLGAEQKAWLLSSLAASDASFKLLLSSVPFDYATGGDGWQAFATERDVLFAHIRDLRVSGVALLSADRHYLSVNHYANGLREYQVGPLAAGPGAPPPMQPGVMARVATLNYGEISVTGGRSPELTFVGRNRNGQALYSESMPPYVLL